MAAKSVCDRNKDCSTYEKCISGKCTKIKTKKVKNVELVACQTALDCNGDHQDCINGKCNLSGGKDYRGKKWYIWSFGDVRETWDEMQKSWASKKSWWEKGIGKTKISKVLFHYGSKIYKRAKI